MIAPLDAAWRRTGPRWLQRQSGFRAKDARRPRQLVWRRFCEKTREQLQEPHVRRLRNRGRNSGILGISHASLLCNDAWLGPPWGFPPLGGPLISAPIGADVKAARRRRWVTQIRRPIRHERHLAPVTGRAGEASNAHKIGKARLGRDGERAKTDNAEVSAFAIDAKDTDAPNAFSATKGDRRRGGCIRAA